MHKKIVFAAILLSLFSQPVLADRDHHRGGRSSGDRIVIIERDRDRWDDHHHHRYEYPQYQRRPWNRFYLSIGDVGFGYGEGGYGRRERGHCRRDRDWHDRW